MGRIARQSKLATEAVWEIWYQDTFDRECPRQVEIAGHGLVAGLIELWARYLHETVQADGREGFSRFNLWWKQESKSIEIVGEWAGAVRLRGWLYGDQRQADRKDILLQGIAIAHQEQILKGETSEKILAAARELENREAFEKWL